MRKTTRNHWCLFTVYKYQSHYKVCVRTSQECVSLYVSTCSGLRPGGTQAYSSRAQPESSSDVEFLWKSYISLVTVFSISRGMTVTTWSSRGHLQCRQIFLQETKRGKKHLEVYSTTNEPNQAQWTTFNYESDGRLIIKWLTWNEPRANWVHVCIEQTLFIQSYYK